MLIQLLPKDLRMTTKTNEAIVREACQVVWSEGQVDRMGEFYAQDFSADYPMTEWGVGLEGAKQLARNVRVGLPDYREQIDELIDAGEHIIVRLTIRGTHTAALGGVAATGREVEFTDVTILTLANGKIVRQRGLSDLLTMYAQLGIVELP